MIELFQEMSRALESETSDVVSLWMNWMGLIFVLSILFVWRHVGARLALGAMLLTMPSALAIYAMTGSVHLIGIAHLLFWTPVAFYIITREMRGQAFKLVSPYGIWAALLVATIIISLVFDVRDIFLVLTGVK